MSDAIQRAKDLIDRQLFFGGFTGVLAGESVTVAPPPENRVGFKRLTESAILPVRAHNTDSGFDLYADETVVVRANETVLVKTGIAVQLPPGYEAQVRPRSGISSKTPLRVILGTVDNGYRGEISIIVDNGFVPSQDIQLSYNDEGDIVGVDLYDDDYTDSFKIEKGSKIAQLVVAPYYTGTSYEVKEELSESERGANGFGSTGV